MAILIRTAGKEKGTTHNNYMNQIKDDVLLACSYENLAWCREKADDAGCGLELISFTEPAILAGDTSKAVAQHKKALNGFAGNLGMHGAFYDMVSGSYDPDIVAITRKRYLQNLEIAAELGVSYVIFHLNYMGILKFPPAYRQKWRERNLIFWEEMTKQAEKYGVTIALENMWEDDPTLISDILQQLSHPYLAACLDVAHLYLFSNMGLKRWVKELAPWLKFTHLNNTDGKFDLHWPLNKGVIPYRLALQRLRSLPNPPDFTLEMAERQWIETSLRFFNLKTPAAKTAPVRSNGQIYAGNYSNLS